MPQEDRPRTEKPLYRHLECDALAASDMRRHKRKAVSIVVEKQCVPEVLIDERNLRGPCIVYTDSRKQNPNQHKNTFCQ